MFYKMFRRFYRFQRRATRHIAPTELTPVMNVLFKLRFVAVEGYIRLATSYLNSEIQVQGMCEMHAVLKWRQVV